MSMRRVIFASVSSVFLAAWVAAAGSANAAQSSADLAAQAYKSLNGGQAAEAVTLYSQAMNARDLSPEMQANALLNRGLAFQQMKQPDKAVADYTAALEIDAMSASLRSMALYNRALARQKLGQSAQAIEDYTSALFLNPEFAEAYLGRANQLRLSGQYLFALSDYERALRHNHPDPARVHFGTAATYEALKRPGDAAQAYRQALAAKPDYQPARERLAQLGGAPEAKPIAADPMQTASIAVVGSASTMVKSAKPKGQEPPPELQPAAISAMPKTMVKQFTDRVPQDETTVATAEAVTRKAPARPVVAEAAAPVISPASAPAEVQGAEPARPEAAAVASAAGWSVQIASAASEDAAWSTFKKMQKAHKVLNGQQPSVVKADLGAKGVFYRVRFAFEAQDDAKAACNGLKAKGVSCFVSRTSM